VASKENEVEKKLWGRW